MNRENKMRKWLTNWWRGESQTASSDPNKSEGSSLSGDDQSLICHSESSEIVDMSHGHARYAITV